MSSGYIGTASQFVGGSRPGSAAIHIGHKQRRVCIDLYGFRLDWLNLPALAVYLSRYAQNAAAATLEDLRTDNAKVEKHFEGTGAGSSIVRQGISVVLVNHPCALRFFHWEPSLGHAIAAANRTDGDIRFQGGRRGGTSL